MRIVTAELLLRRLTDTVERSLSQQLPTPYLRSQSTAIVSLLSNLAERMEEKAELLAPGSREMRNILEESLEILSAVKGAGTAIKPIKTTLGMTSTSHIEESAALRQALYQAIEALYRWESKLDSERLAALRIRIRVHLRCQLDQDMAIYHPVRAGKMLRGG